MYGKIKKKMGFALLPVAFFFLFDPSYALLDPLPDFIGYIILCSALINVSDISTRVSEAFVIFRKATILSVLKYLSLFLLYRFFNEEGIAVGRLLFVFVFAFFEIILLLPAYKSLFSGLLTLGMFDESEAIYKQKHARSSNATEKLYTFTIVFVIIKNVIGALPEFTSLQNNSNYEFVSLLRLFAFVFVLPFSIIWLINSVKYFKSIGDDIPFIDRISSKYLEHAEAAPKFYLHRVLSVGLALMAVAFATCIDVYSDNLNFLPDLVFYSISLLTVLFLKNYSRKWRPAVIIMIIGALVSAVSDHFERNFFSEYTISAIKRDIEAYNGYYAVFFTYIAQSIVLVAAVAILLCMLWDIYKTHSSVSRPDKQSDRGKNIRSFNLRALFTLVFAVFSAAASVYYCWSLPFFRLGWYCYYSGMINTVISLVFISLAESLVFYIKNSITENYKLYL